MKRSGIRFDAAGQRMRPHVSVSGLAEADTACSTQEAGAESSPAAAADHAVNPVGESSFRSDACCAPHEMECLVQRELLAHPQMSFSSLVIRRMHDGICLQGVVEADDSLPEAIRIARQVAGVERVISQLVVRRPDVRRKKNSAE